MTTKKNLITLEVELETLAEFSAAVAVFGARSKSSLLHQQVVAKIREAKELVSKAEFEKLIEAQKEKISERSKQKSLERKRSINKVKSITAPTKQKNKSKAQMIDFEKPTKEKLNFSGKTTNKRTNKQKEAELKKQMSKAIAEMEKESE